MKRVINISDKAYELLKSKSELDNVAESIIANSIPYEERPQGEYVDISKLRLMTVEECAGHTIDYAMGWKACIEWIKKGGATNDT